MQGKVVASTNAIASFEQTFLRQGRTVFATFIAVVVIVDGLLGYLILAYPELFPSAFLSLVIVIAVGGLSFTIYLRRELAKTLLLLRALAHRLTPTGAGRGPTLVFDNGLVLALETANFYLFGSPTGEKAIPRAEDVGPLLRHVLRLRRALRIGRKQGPESLRIRLEGIRKSLNASFAWIFVYLPKPTAPPDPRRPSWIVSVSFGGFRLHAGPILMQIDSLAALLEEALAAGAAPSWASVGPQPVSGGLGP